MNASTLEQLLEQIEQERLPPVDQWRPERVAELDMRIRRDGTWEYRGSPIQRERMVQLFATVLVAEYAGDDPLLAPQQRRYALVTPSEKLYIKVDDAPLLAVSVDRHEDPQGNGVLTLLTNTGSAVVVDAQHPLFVIHAAATGEPSPYVIVRAKLPALLTRSAYYQLAAFVETVAGTIGVSSCGQFFPLDTDCETNASGA